MLLITAQSPKFMTHFQSSITSYKLGRRMLTKMFYYSYFFKHYEMYFRVLQELIQMLKLQTINKKKDTKDIIFFLSSVTDRHAALRFYTYDDKWWNSRRTLSWTLTKPCKRGRLFIRWNRAIRGGLNHLLSLSLIRLYCRTLCVWLVHIKLWLFVAKCRNKLVQWTLPYKLPKTEMFWRY